VTTPNGHAHDADVIVANNADVFRVVGTNGAFGSYSGVPNAAGFGAFNYDLQGYVGATEHIVARAVRLLDYTLGGPDLASGGPDGVQAGPLVVGQEAGNGIGDIGGTPMTFEGVALQLGSEIHAEGGDAFIYGGPADDTIFGGGQNDTIILGYGDNWVDGGRGDQCIIGGGARCLMSRDSSSFGEPLYGIAAIPAANLTQLITTPGNVQQAVINQAGAVKYTALLYPYNWDPATYAGTGRSNNSPTFSTGCKQNQVCPHYQPKFGHNVIYGGWGGGVIHGGPGQSALSGTEAPGSTSKSGVIETAFTDNYNLNGDQLNAAPIETDWYHPFNPGNPMGWVPLNANLHGNAARASQIGKATYFNTEDPRRKVMLNAGGTNCVWAAGADWTTCAFNWFLNFDPTDPALELDTRWYFNTGHPQEPVTGDKAIFGDLGNDWIVAGMGRVRVYGGWGNDVIDLRASMNVDGGLNDMPVPNVTDGSAGTPAWESLAYGGAGQDIFFAGTGGDRLIDWVGNHNSYYVPFSQFGMPAVSRTLQPFLPEFLYALSKSDGADQTLGPRYGGAASRNGEPFGELGLVLQHDDAWHQQVGPPFNEMPENLGGTANDVAKTANVLPFRSPGTDPPASLVKAAVGVPSGLGVNLPSGTNTPGASSVPLYVTGTPGAAVSYSFTEGTFIASGSGVLSQKGQFGATVDVSTFPDGTINVKVTLVSGGATTTLTATLGKNSVPPPAPSVAAPAYANIANNLAYTLTITGQAGSIATVVMTDGGLPLPNVANGMDMVGSTGTLSLPVDASNLADGSLSVSVTLTNGAGDSVAWTGTIIKDTVAPVVTLTAPPYINIANVSTYQPTVASETNAIASYVVTDGKHTQTGTKAINSSGKWNLPITASAFNDGPVTITVTVTDPAGNTTTVVTTVFKDTAAPAGTFTIAGTTINGVVAVTNPALSITPSFTAASGIASVLYSVNGGAAAPTVTLPSVDGVYTVTALVISNAGNSAGFSKSVRLDRTGPTITSSITAPTNAGSYDVGQAVALTYSATDADNVASLTALLDGTTSISSGVAFNTETLTPGSHTIVITAKDGLGNVSTTTLTITVHATVAGLTTAVNDGVTAGKITSSTLATQLNGYLSSAQTALNAGNHTAAKAYLASFVSAVNGAGTSISAAYAALLVAWANDLIGRL